jgi:hypothetical protein
MSTRDVVRGHGPDGVVPYEPANERIAKAVAFVGSYFIWVVLTAFVGVFSILAVQ